VPPDDVVIPSATPVRLGPRDLTVEANVTLGNQCDPTLFGRFLALLGMTE